MRFVSSNMNLTVLSNLPNYGHAIVSIEFPLHPGLLGVPSLTSCPWASIPEELPVLRFATVLRLQG
jgi:hypothetical protein